MKCSWDSNGGECLNVLNCVNGKWERELGTSKVLEDKPGYVIVLRGRRGRRPLRERERGREREGNEGGRE